jgi:CO/xanthine dehydrogenase Mo-binding subunit
VTSLTVTINGRAYGPRDVRDDLTMNDFLREYLGLTGTKFGCGFNRIGSAYTAGCGTLVRIEIDRATGALRIAKAYSVFECGQVLVPEVVVGQAQGGFAMGVGFAFLETLPLYEDGPGSRLAET